jgi:hypothetical protein
MSQWVRLWEGMTIDPKWRVVKVRALQNVSSVSIGDIVSVFAHMLTTADKNGNLVNWCDEDVAAALEYKVELVCAIREAMQGKVLDGNHLKGWDNRQPNGNDLSTKRVRAFRERRNDLKRSETPEEKRREDSSLRSESKNKNLSVFTKKPNPEKNSIEKKEKTGISMNANPARIDYLFAADAGMDGKRAAEEWAKFLDYHRKNGSMFADWHAAWRSWVRKAIEIKPNGHDPPEEHHPPLTQIFIEVDTPQWNAWTEFSRKSGGKGYPQRTHSETRKRGWDFAAEYPPLIEP